MLGYPRRAMFGNGHDTWEIDVLYGDAVRRGRAAVLNEHTFTAKDGMRFAHAVAKRKGEDPPKNTVNNGYQWARQMALAKFNQLQKEDPVA